MRRRRLRAARARRAGCGLPAGAAPGPRRAVSTDVLLLVRSAARQALGRARQQCCVGVNLSFSIYLYQYVPVSICISMCVNVALRLAPCGEGNFGL